MSQYVVCSHFAKCDDSHNCGGARPHLSQYCEPCKRFSSHSDKPKCVPVAIGKSNSCCQAVKLLNKTVQPVTWRCPVCHTEV